MCEFFAFQRVENGKTFRDYITEYKCDAQNDAIHQLADGLGIDEAKLRNLIELHPSESDINAFGRYDDLIATLDISKAQKYFENKTGEQLTLRKVKILVDSELRRVITEGI